MGAISHASANYTNIDKIDFWSNLYSSFISLLQSYYKILIKPRDIKYSGEHG